MKRPLVRSLLLSSLVAFLIPLGWGQDSSLPYVFTTFAGKAGSRGSVDGTGGDARFVYPWGLAFDLAGNLYVTDAQDHTVRRITPLGAVSTLAGRSGQAGSTDGAIAVARFGGPPVQVGAGVLEITGPFGITVSSIGMIYVADGGNHTVRRFQAGGAVETYAGRPQTKGSANGSAFSATFNNPQGVAVDSAGNVYVTDTDNHTIRVITPNLIVGTLAGLAGVPGSADQTANDIFGGISLARFAFPNGIAIDAAGRIFVGDSFLTLRRLIPSATAPFLVNGTLIVPQPVVATVAGRAGRAGNLDGASSFAAFGSNEFGTLVTSPMPGSLPGLALDPSGNLMVADCGNDTLRQLGVDGTVSTLGGRERTPAFADGVANDARFSGPSGIAVDRAGNIYVADAGNAVIRRGTRAARPLIVTQPQGGTVNPGQSFSFSVLSAGNPVPTFQWSRDGVPIDGATGATLTLDHVQPADAGNYVVVATNPVGVAASNGATLGVAALPVVTTPPASQTVAKGQSVTLSVTATGVTSYQWRKDGVAIAGATNATLVLANVQPADAGAYAVLVTNAAGSTLTGAATVIVDFGRIINLSVFTSVTGAGDSFTIGYVVGGGATKGAKSVVIRAAGPSLGALGVPNVLADPKFDLFAGAVKSGGNDDWGGSPSLVTALASVGAFAYVGPASKDAAVFTTVATGDNSMVVSAADNGSGSVLAEIYDATPRDTFVAATPRLINVSVRKDLGTGLTAGFVLGGLAPTRVLIRAVGPTLAGFGVAGAVGDPQLTLFNDKSVKIAENNDWGGTPELSAAFTAIGAFALPAGSKDAATLVTLPPGLYSVQVSGIASTTGVALVEIYELP